MLAQDQPVSATSAKMDYDGAAGVATYTGQAKLWQEKTQVQGDVIVVDDKSGNLTARGHVRSVMFFDEVDTKTNKKQAVQTTATGDTMVYEEARRLATYTTGPTAQAHLVGSQGDVTADRIELFLKEGSKELDRAEADGKVTVIEGVRTATGQHLTYTPANATYVMTGTPVQVVEKTPNECRISDAHDADLPQGRGSDDDGEQSLRAGEVPAVSGEVADGDASHRRSHEIVRRPNGSQGREPRRLVRRGRRPARAERRGQDDDVLHGRSGSRRRTPAGCCSTAPT